MLFSYTVSKQSFESQFIVPGKSKKRHLGSYVLGMKKRKVKSHSLSMITI